MLKRRPLCLYLIWFDNLHLSNLQFQMLFVENNDQQLLVYTYVSIIPIFIHTRTRSETYTCTFREVPMYLRVTYSKSNTM